MKSGIIYFATSKDIRVTVGVPSKFMFIRKSVTLVRARPTLFCSCVRKAARRKVNWPPGCVLSQDFENPLKKNRILTVPAAPLSDVTFLLPSLLPSFLASVTTRHGICFPGDGLRTNRPYLSAPKNLGESWFAFPGTKIFQKILFSQLCWFLTKSQTLKPNLILLTNHLK